MKKILFLLPLLALGGCGAFDKFAAHVMGYSIICVKETGIEYVQFSSGAAPLYNANGTLVTCK